MESPAIPGRFKSKDHGLVGAQPVRHWTDGKIRCHFFTCVAAMTYLRRLELKLEAAGVRRTAADVMDDMRHLHSVLLTCATCTRCCCCRPGRGNLADGWRCRRRPRLKSYRRWGGGSTRVGSYSGQTHNRLGLNALGEVRTMDC